MTRTSRRFQRQLAGLAFLAVTGLCLSIASTPPPAAPARALQEAPPPAYGGRADSSLPPVRFQQLDGGTVAAVAFVPIEAVPRLCAKLGTPVFADYVTRGCTVRRSDGLPMIIMPNPCLAPGPYMSPAYVACHEIGHANGWTGTHGE